jgi:putative endonuclease
MKSSNIIGKNGEELVRDMLISQGFELVVQNYSYRRDGVRGQLGEIDLIMKKDKILHIIEVKSQNSFSLTKAIERITPKKLQYLYTSYQGFLSKNSQYKNMMAQIDVALVIENKVEMIWRVT